MWVSSTALFWSLLNHSSALFSLLLNPSTAFIISNTDLFISSIHLCDFCLILSHVFYLFVEVLICSPILPSSVGILRILISNYFLSHSLLPHFAWVSVSVSLYLMKQLPLFLEEVALCMIILCLILPLVVSRPLRLSILPDLFLMGSICWGYPKSCQYSTGRILFST